MRISRQVLQVLRVFFDTPSTPFSGSCIHRKIGLANGTIYPILCRLEQAGWLESKWEEIDPSEEGRPRKRLYRLTRTGAIKTEAEFNLLLPGGQQGDLANGYSSFTTIRSTTS